LSLSNKTISKVTEARSFNVKQSLLGVQESIKRKRGERGGECYVEKRRYKRVKVK
jgi:hypothetical protein